MKKQIFLFFLLIVNFTFSQSSDFDNGLNAFEDKNYDRAIEFFTKSIIKDHGLNAYYNRARTYYITENYLDAIEDFTVVLDKDDLDIDAWYSRSLAYYELGELKKAFYDSRKALKIDTNYYKAYTTIGLCYAAWDKPNHAIRFFNKALAYKQSALLYYNRALVYQKIDDFKNAEKDFTSAIHLKDDINYYWGRANLFYKNGDYKMCIEDYSSAIDISDTIPALYYNRGLSYYSDYQNEYALSDFKQTIALDKKDINAKWYIVLCNYEQENYEEALKYYNEIEKQDSNFNLLEQIDKKELENKISLARNFWYYFMMLVLVIALLFLTKKLLKKKSAF